MKLLLSTGSGAVSASGSAPGGRAGVALRLLCFGALVLACLAPRIAGAVAVNCSGGGDRFGWTVAAAGDYDGDGVADFAVGSPCARASRQGQAGRVRVFSGTDQRVLLSIKGDGLKQHLGSALAFVGDLSGEGADELAVGSSGFAVPKLGGSTVKGAGKLEVYSFHSGLAGQLLPAYTLFGDFKSENRGEAVAGLDDVNGDGVPDFIVGGGGRRFDGDSKGEAWVVSGADASILFRDAGSSNFDDRWSSVVGRAGDADNDGIDDILIASAAFDEPLPPAALSAVVVVASTTTLPPTTTVTTSSTTTTTLPRNVGAVKLFSGAPPYNEIVGIMGSAKEENLGRSVAGSGDINGDSLEDFAAGAPGAALGELNGAGRVSVLSADGALLYSVGEPVPQAGAAFGTALAMPGDLDNDGIEDLVASAPVASSSGNAKAGRVHAISGAVGHSALWSLEGELPNTRLGQAIASLPDMNGDGVAELFIGAPGDAPLGRRGAGTARVISGADGGELLRLRGRRGLETRIFVAGLRNGRRLRVSSFTPFGRKRELRNDAFRLQRGASGSLAVLNDFASAEAGKVLLAVAGGSGGAGPYVSVLRAGRRRSRVSRFKAAEGAYSGGINVAAGNLAEVDPGDGDEIAAAQADLADGDVSVVIYRSAFVDPEGSINWSKVRAFDLFRAGETLNGELIAAIGANIAVGNLSASAGDEIVAAPVAGLPVVAVYSRSGSLQNRWLAYPPEGSAGIPNSGVNVAVGDLDGDGVNEIVTAPQQGQLWIRAWRGDGQEFSGADGPVSFFVSFGLSFKEGVRVAVADVDFDEQGEILVVPAAGVAGSVKAFEVDGSPVAGWRAFMPLGPGSRSGLSIAATDRFLRP